MSTAAPLIGLTGHAGSGKDSAAAMLATAGWQTIAFADALRVEIAAAWHIDIRELTDRATKEAPRRTLAAGHGDNANWRRFLFDRHHSLAEPRSARWVMQQWAEFRRTSDPLHWVRHVVCWAQHQRLHGAPGLCVTDVRFANEALALRGLGGHIVRVHRPGHTAPLEADTATHESERHEQLTADGDIHNAGSLAELGAEVWRVVGALLQQQEPSHE